MYSYGPPHMAVQKQDDQHEHKFSNYVRIQDVVQKTCLRRWTVGKSGERGSGISVLPARHDDDDIYTNLLSTSIHGYQEKEKTPEFRDNNIPNHCLEEKEKKIFLGKKLKKRPTSSLQLKKIKGYTVRWSKEQKPTVKCCNATITNSDLYKSGANYRN